MPLDEGIVDGHRTGDARQVTNTIVQWHERGLL